MLLSLRTLFRRVWHRQRPVQPHYRVCPIGYRGIEPLEVRCVLTSSLNATGIFDASLADGGYVHLRIVSDHDSTESFPASFQSSFQLSPFHFVSKFDSIFTWHDGSLHPDEATLVDLSFGSIGGSIEFVNGIAEYQSGVGHYKLKLNSANEVAIEVTAMRPEDRDINGKLIRPALTSTVSAIVQKSIGHPDLLVRDNNLERPAFGDRGRNTGPQNGNNVYETVPSTAQTFTSNVVVGDAREMIVQLEHDHADVFLTDLGVEFDIPQNANWKYQVFQRYDGINQSQPPIDITAGIAGKRYFHVSHLFTNTNNNGQGASSYFDFDWLIIRSTPLTPQALNEPFEMTVRLFDGSSTVVRDSVKLVTKAVKPSWDLQLDDHNDKVGPIGRDLLQDPPAGEQIRTVVVKSAASGIGSDPFRLNGQESGHYFSLGAEVLPNAIQGAGIGGFFKYLDRYRFRVVESSLNGWNIGYQLVGSGSGTGTVTNEVRTTTGVVGSRSATQALVIKGVRPSTASTTDRNVTINIEVLDDLTGVVCDVIQARIDIPATPIIVNTTSDESDKNSDPSVIDVDLKLPGNQVSLRAAIDYANSNPGRDVIEFNIPGGQPTIKLESDLPEITSSVVIDATTQKSVVALDGQSNGNAFFITGGNTTIKGFHMFGFKQDVILIEDQGSNLIEKNTIGIIPGQDRVLASVRNGVSIVDSADNTIIDNTISGHGESGVTISSRFPDTGNAHSNYIINNRIGTTQDGSSSGTDTGLQSYTLGNKLHGIAIKNSRDNTLRENVIAGNWQFGIKVTGSVSTGQVIEENLIGANASKSKAIGNADGGILILNAGRAQIRNNVIGGNGDHRIQADQAFGLLNENNGLTLDGVGTSGATIEGNLIGVSPNGQPLPNYGRGLYLINSSDVTIQNNTLSGNIREGVVLQSVVPGDGLNNQILNNRIGTTPDGMAKTANYRGLTLIGVESTTIRGNVISGNDFDGILVAGDFNVLNGLAQDQLSNKTLIDDNTIGLSKDLALTLPNSQSGIVISDRSTNTTVSNNRIAGNRHGITVDINADFHPGSQLHVIDNQIGVTTNNQSIRGLKGNVESGIHLTSVGAVIGEPGRGNTIVGNRVGILIDGQASKNVIRSNRIGTDISGTEILGNSEQGILITGDAFSNVVGGDRPADANLIAFNGTQGIGISRRPGRINDRNSFQRNAIYENGRLPIDLGLDGPSPNDPLDADTGGANNGQNSPSLTRTAGGSGLLTGRLSSKPRQSYVIELFADDGRTFLERLNITTDSNGLATFQKSYSASTVGIVATATDSLTGDTSELVRSIDGDRDGVPDDVEGTSDYNADGIQDILQSSVAALTGSGGIAVGLAVASPFLLSQAAITDIPPSADPPGDTVFGAGFIGYKVTGLSSGQTETVDVLLPGNKTGIDYWKFGPEPGDLTPHWWKFQYDGTTGAEILNGGHLIRLHQQDGGRGDLDGLANGTISDLGGTVLAKNIPPTVLMTGPTTVVNSVPVAFQFQTTDTDAGTLDMFSYQIDWNGDGVVDQIFNQSGAQIQVSHEFQSSGEFHVNVTVTDLDGAESPLMTILVTVQDYARVGDVLVVNGTTGNDKLELLKGKGADQVVLKIGGKVVGTYSGLTVVEMYGGDGKDTLKVDPRLSLIAKLFGGKGDDKLSGGLGDDVLDGGDDRDVLNGGGGRNILRGGEGNDTLIGSADPEILLGGGGDDLLKAAQGRDFLFGGLGKDTLQGGVDTLSVGGTTDFDSDTTALEALFREWLTLEPLAARTANLENGTGLTGGRRLKAPDTVHDDGVPDTFKGKPTGTLRLLGTGDLQR